jgi:protein-S-isoprenylcysteine O-methyltransferase Ste14
VFTFELSIWNVWLLSLPLFAVGALFMGLKKGIAKRMSDMTGYTSREKLFTVSASLAPYPFMLATVWTPFTTTFPLLYLGLSVYVVGFALYAVTLRAIVRTRHDEPFSSGPYRHSRNPLYVAATIAFTGMCLAGANIILAAYLTVAVILQHFMILAEERICRQKYGTVFEEYLKRVPRYLLV